MSCRLKRLTKGDKYFVALCTLLLVSLLFRYNNEPSAFIKSFRILKYDPKVISFEPILEKFVLSDGISQESRKYIEELQLENPGENGDGVELPKNLSSEIQNLINQGQDANGFNSFISNMISLNREIPDIRSDICKSRNYTDLPKCSIIIIFHNEDWSLLMRTVHSILLRSSLKLIEEILLVDDASDREILKKPLDEYIKTLPKVRVVRAHRRIGIISARILGAVNAVGPILVHVRAKVLD